MTAPQRIVNVADMGPLLGLKGLGCSLVVVPPGISGRITPAG